MKKLISVLIALVVTFAMIPANVFADDTCIFVSYGDGISLDVDTDLQYEKDKEPNKVFVYQEGNVEFNAKSNTADTLLKSVTVKSGSFNNSLNDTKYDTTEGVFEADSSGTVSLSLNLKKDRAYLIYATFENNEIYISYSGDVTVDNVLGVSYENDKQSCILTAKAEGSISFDVKAKLEDCKLESVRVSSRQLPCEFSDPFNIKEGDFEADSSGKATVTLDLKKDKWYTIDYETEGSGTYISYSGDVTVDNASGVSYDNDKERCILTAKKEGTISFNVKSNAKYLKLKSINVMSCKPDEATSIDMYKTDEGTFKANSAGVVKVKLDISKEKSYLLNADFIENNADDNMKDIKQTVSGIKPTVSTSKAAKGIKLTLKTKGTSINGIKSDGYRVEYKIYRASKKNGKYTLKKTTTAKTYTDKSVKKSKTYYYKVRVFVKDSEGKTVGLTNLAESNVSGIKYR